MEKLIEFLIRNIYIVIVVGGFLLSAIGKMRGSNNRQPRQMPPFGGGERQPAPSPVYDSPDIRRSVSQREWEDEDEEEDSPDVANTPAVEQRPSRPAYQAVTAAPTPSRQPQSADSGTSPYTAGHQGNQPASELTAATLRQAIVWSEVLGPPRAKRPWRSKS
ncbi:hypothetical protein DFQ01_12710 [Paenibacillus cellulosilyticus]|uniref:Uncharacterized protein n=1 Tax=Paenibacillus cellulosilyticus TaxID=375489 RepID=A0A2V2YM24_9BACL|nr:hypothetical protein [Paenibacillus cellulosilyticus]PWV95408.1 hypothetical protein DFQ01_12710 [Paenibacillus cellulosilyticus]QKS43211.1 hypothetical protein HUB94_01680 [Paenibacillus cellulosilyticus]